MEVKKHHNVTAGIIAGILLIVAAIFAVYYFRNKKANDAKTQAAGNATSGNATLTNATLDQNASPVSPARMLGSQSNLQYYAPGQVISPSQTQVAGQGSCSEILNGPDANGVYWGTGTYRCAKGIYLKNGTFIG
jgi:hypothetical protein